MNNKGGESKFNSDQLESKKEANKSQHQKIDPYILIYTSYQVQRWKTMILSPVKAQPNGSNVT